MYRITDRVAQRHPQVDSALPNADLSTRYTSLMMIAAYDTDAYLTDTYLTELETEILETGREGSFGLLGTV